MQSRVVTLSLLLLTVTVDAFSMKLFEKPHLKADSFEKLKQIVETQIKGQKNPLIVFDIDETLVDRGPLFQDIFRHLSDHEKFEDREMQDRLLTTFYTTNPEIPVHQDQVKWFNSLQKKAKVICLTSIRGDKFGLIKDFYTFRRNLLLTLNYNIQDPFSLSPNDFLCDIKGSCFRYCNGMLCTGDFSHKAPFTLNGVTLSDKGFVLYHFLSALKRKTFYPSKVIFIDNCKHYLKTVKEAMNHFAVDATMIHYTAIYEKQKYKEVEQLNDTARESKVYKSIIEILKKTIEDTNNRPLKTTDPK